MEINNLQSNMISAYKKATPTGGTVKKETAAAAAKTDKVEFDFGRYLGAAKTDAASRVGADARAARIEQLTKDYADDNCPVSAENVAAAIIGE